MLDKFNRTMDRLEANRAASFLENYFSVGAIMAAAHRLQRQTKQQQRVERQQRHQAR